MSSTAMSEPRIGLVPIVALYMLMLVFVGNLAELHPVFGFRGLGVLTLIFGLFAFAAAKGKQSLTAYYKQCPLFVVILVFMLMVYVSVPFSVYITGAFKGAQRYFYVTVSFFLMLSMAKGRHGLRVLLGSGLAVFIVLSIGLVKNYGMGRISMFEDTYDPNDVAYVLVSLLPLMYYYLQTTKKVLTKCVGYIVVLLSLVAIALTQSRGGALTMVVIFLLYLRFEKVSPRLIVVGLLVTVVGMYFLPDTFWERMSTLTNIEDDYNYTSDAGRLAIWEQGVDLFKNNLITGVGIGQFATANFMVGNLYLTAHNAFVQVGAELGIIGLGCYVWIVLSPLKVMKRRINDPAMQNRENYPLYKGLYISFAAQFVGSLFLSVGYFNSLYYLLAVYLILNLMELRLDRKEMESDEPELAPEPLRGPMNERGLVKYKQGTSYKMRKNK